jgi:hypothetical protein
MKLGMKRAIAGASAFAIAGATAVALAGVASASVPSPWEPDPNSKGSVVFYDAAGNVLTGGNNLSHIADYFVASTAGSAGATKATLFFAAPDHTQADPAAWAQVQRSASVTYPAATNPAPITGPGFTFPVVKAGATDANLSTFLSAVTLDGTANYANIVQVRVYDSLDTANYWETNISYNSAAGTWSVNDPTVTSTTTTLTASPPSPQTSPASAVTLNATVAPASNGTVKFFEGGTQLGTTQNVTTASGAASVNIGAPALGTHTYTAVFTPAGGILVTGSTSTPLSYLVQAPAIGTTTVLAVNPGAGPALSPETFTANVTTADSSTTTGTVTFKDGSTTLNTTASQSTSSPFTYSTSSLTQGTHTITATFTPGTTAYNSSVSAPQTFDLTAPACTGGGTGCIDTQNIQADIAAGTIVINTPYHTGNPLDVPLTLDPTASFYSGNAAFNSIKVTDTRAGNLPWDLKAQASQLTFGTNAIDGQNVGLTGLTVDATATNTVSQAAGNLTVTNAPAASPPVAAGAPGTAGLGGAQHTLVHANAGLGTITYKGTLTINAPTNLPAGTYAGTITFTVG